MPVYIAFIFLVMKMKLDDGAAIAAIFLGGVILVVTLIVVAVKNKLATISKVMGMDLWLGGTGRRFRESLPRYNK